MKKLAIGFSLSRKWCTATLAASLLLRKLQPGIAYLLSLGALFRLGSCFCVGGFGVFLFTEVGGLDAGIGEQGFARAFENGLAGLKDVGVVGDFEGFFGVLLDQEDGVAFLMDLLDDVEDFLNQNRGEAQGGLVEHEDFRLDHQSAGHGQHLLFTAGERSGFLPGTFAQNREELEGMVDAFVDGVFVIDRVGAEHQVFAHTEVGEDVPSFGREGDPLFDNIPGGHIGEVDVVTDDAATALGDLVHDGAQGRGFSGTVGPDQGDNLVVTDVHGKSLNGFDAAIVDMEIFYFKHCPPPDKPQ